MDRVNGLDAFHFDDYQILDDQIDSVAEFNLLSVENYGQADLAGDLKAALPEFVSETTLVTAFKKTWAKN